MKKKKIKIKLKMNGVVKNFVSLCGGRKVFIQKKIKKTTIFSNCSW